MTYHDILRLSVIVLAFAVAAFVVAQLLAWHADKRDPVNLRDIFTRLGKDKKQHLSLPAVGEAVALWATTSGYLGVLAAKPEAYETATLVYGGLWVARGGYSTYLRSKEK